jgi:hypothetical protein
LKAVTLSLAGMTLGDGLSQIVHGAPGLVWVLREQWTEHRQERTCTFRVLQQRAARAHLVRACQRAWEALKPRIVNLSRQPGA